MCMAGLTVMSSAYKVTGTEGTAEPALVAAAQSPPELGGSVSIGVVYGFMSPS